MAELEKAMAGAPGSGSITVDTNPAPVTEITPTEPSNSIALPVTEQQIAELAYSYWEARGCQDGSAEEDWYRAEQELRARADSTA
jgi:hypothetical protein